ncbi:MAG: signal peptide peptidase SppA [Bacteroidetes bacterium]|nr:MAG: signal peptide peptidase SppA [Bacteroidota bacterium]
MKDFFKFMFASMLGFFLSSIILFLLFLGFVMAIVSFTQNEEVVVNESSFLHIKLDYTVEDRSSNDPLADFTSLGSLKITPGLNEILKSIEKAKNDDRIKGIYLDLGGIPSGLATISEIRIALDDFSKTGKPIYSYSNILSQKAYYLASVSDKIFLNPEGFIEFKGYNAQGFFIKNLLEKLEIEPQVIRHGKFKSAVEPLLRTDMSEPNKEQTLKFINSMWDNSLDNISGSRNITIKNLNLIADSLQTQNAAQALSLHLVDSLVYYDEFLNFISNKIDVENIKKKNLISLGKYTDAKVKPTKKRSKNKIAIVYASGDIVQGEGANDNIGSDKIARAIRSARIDESIKAVVLRVNSPGGDALASDIILREVNLTKNEKPIVVSLGNLAASGGYYIACGADKIFASPSTITGSIGVFGIIPNFEKFFNNKLGITFDGVKTNENSDFMSTTKPLSKFQHDLIQIEIERIYSTFIGHVAKGRNMTTEEVDKIGQGRVWSGSDALEIGLIDGFGGLDKAIMEAKELANLEDYRIVELPKQKEPIEQIMDDLLGKTRIKILQSELGGNYKFYQFYKKVEDMNGIQARLPFEIEIN